MEPKTERGIELAALPANWFNHRSKQIDVRAIVAAERYIEENELHKCAGMYPMVGGGVQVEWFDDEDRECEIEFTPEGIPGGVYVEGRSD